MSRDDTTRPASAGAGRTIQIGNLFASQARIESGEVFETLLRGEQVHIERILSSAEPDPVLYDQEWDEWVCLLQGEAELMVDGVRIDLRTGDHLFIPARTPHRVLRASVDPHCLWLAVHLLDRTSSQ